jgi:hypothetical protein
LSDTDAAFVAIALPVIKKEKRKLAAGAKSDTNEDHNTHTEILRLSEPNDYKIFCSWIVHHLMSYSRLLPQQSLKEIHARSYHSWHLSIILGYLNTGNAIEDLKFITAICS